MVFLTDKELAQVLDAAAADPTWTDVASVGLLAAQLLVLIVAAWFGLRQVGEARRLREAQVRPFVTIDFQISQTIIWFVIRNVGTTVARNVTFEFDPPLTTSFDTEPTLTPPTKLKIFAEGIPSLVPGKELTGVFDRFPARASQEGHSDSYHVTIRYRSDALKRDYTDETVLDLGIYRNVLRMTKKDLDDVAKSLETIGKELQKWTAFGGALHVVSDEDLKRRREEFDAEWEAEDQKLAEEAAANASEPSPDEPLSGTGDGSSNE